MRKNMKQAWDKFIAGETFSSKNKSINVTSNQGVSVLYSYAMPIAWKTGSAILVTEEKGPSVTTSSHIRMIRELVFYYRG